MISWLYGLQGLGIKLGLDGIRGLVGCLGHPEREFRCLLVGGTNGKGSVAAMIEGLLTAHGVRTGLFTSPHLVHPGERIRIAGRDLNDEALASRLARVKQAIEQGLTGGVLETHPSFFEVMTATAFDAFRAEGVEAAVLEVGLGGRLDATNATDPLVSVLVGVDLDHTRILGESLEAIATEKVAIARAGRPLISGLTRQGPIRVVQRASRTLGASLVEARAWTRFEVEQDGVLTFRTPGGDYPGVELALEGRHQIDNARIALAAFEHFVPSLGVAPDPEAVRSGFAATRWPGRLQWLPARGGRPGLLLDGAHNPAGIETLCSYLRTLTRPPAVVLFAAMSDKPAGALLEPLREFVETAVITRPPLERAADPAEIAAAGGRLFSDVRIEPDAAAALDLACSLARRDGYVLVAGSLYLVGEVLRLLARSSAAGPVPL